MRFDEITIHNIGPFKDLCLDLTALPRVVAVVGANGAGKTTLLELLAGALTRECPTRGPLAGLARARDAWVEVRCTSGAPWTIRQTVDAVSGKGEALVLDAAGAPALGDTKVRSFDAWASSHLPAPEVLYAAQFGAQGEGGFLALKAGQRKAVLLRLLGVERLERMASAAGEQRRDALTLVDRTQAQLGELRGPAPADALDVVEQARERVASAEHRSRDAALRVSALANATAAVRAELARVRAVVADRERVASEGRALDVQIVSAEGERVGMLERAKNNRMVLESAAAIREGVRRLAECREQAAAIDAEDRDAAAALIRAAADAAAARDAGARAEAGLDAAMARRAALTRRLVEPLRALSSAAAQLPELREAEARCAAHLAHLDRDLTSARAAQVAGAAGRIAPLRSSLVRIAAGVAAPAEDAAAALHDDGVVEVALVALPGRIASLEASHRDAIAESRRVERGHMDASVAEAQRSQVEVMQADLAGLEGEIGAAGEAIAGARAELRFAADLQAEAAQVAGAAGDRRVDHGRELATLAAVEQRHERLLAAEGRLEELAPQIEAADGTLARLHAERAALVLDGAEPTLPDLEYAEREEWDAYAQSAAAAASLATAQAAISTALARYQDTLAADARRAELDAQLAEARVAVADWTKLQADLGRDGIQALEIDAAGPELSALATDLLHHCVGPRWTVTVDTQRIGADGRMLESLEVRVLDTEAGREGPVETYSGGERVLIGEAVSLALTMLACRASGQRDVTIVRDESGAALDAAKARAYVEMLRRACDHIGARQVLIVSHSPEVADLCDCRLVVADGTVEVQS